MMTITTCRNCGMRVVPKSDGTCPSCLADVSAKERIEPSDRKMARREANNRDILRMVGFSWYMYCLSFFFGVVFVVTGTNHPIVGLWWPGLAGILLSVVLTSAIVYVGFSQRRAYKLHFSFSLLTTCWIIPLVASLVQSGSVGLPIILGLTVVLVISLFFSYEHTLRKLRDSLRKETSKGESGRGLWRVRGVLGTGTKSKLSSNIAQVLIPLGIGLGTIIARRPSDSGELASSILMMGIGCALTAYPGKQLAIACYLRGQEKKLNKAIVI